MSQISITGTMPDEIEILNRYAFCALKRCREMEEKINPNYRDRFTSFPRTTDKDLSIKPHKGRKYIQ